MKTLKIGVDFDDVLFGFNEGFAGFYNTLYGTSFTRSNVKQYGLHHTYGGTQEEVSLLIQKFLKSEEHKKVAPILGAKEHLQNLIKHEFIIVSARSEQQSREVVTEWLNIHFPNFFQKIHLTGSVDKNAEHVKPKEGVALEYELDVFIEDSLSVASRISAVGIPVILLDTPWNQGEVPEGVTRVFSWAEIVQEIKKIETR